MESLKRIDFSQNHIDSLLFPLKMPQLHDLNLSKNKIKDIGRNSFDLLKSLRTLNLNQNALTSFESFPKTTTLETVIVSFNRLKQ